jgi:molybdate transport system permease protein
VESDEGSLLEAERRAIAATREGETRSGALGRLAATLALSVAVALFAGFLVLPIIALLLRVPLSRFLEYAARPVVLDALALSLFTTLISLGLMLLLGTPVAYVLGRHSFRGKRLLETLVEVPLVMPPAVAGVALLLAFGRRGLLGPAFEGAGLDIAFSTAAVVLAQTFVASPFYVKAARTGFQSVPVELEESAATEGAGRWARFRHVVLPLALPGIVGGAVVAWARALGEFGATILFAGNFQGRTQTMPLAIYTALESDLNAAIVLSAILVVASFALLITFKLLSGRQFEIVGMGE